MRARTSLDRSRLTADGRVFSHRLRGNSSRKLVVSEGLATGLEPLENFRLGEQERYFPSIIIGFSESAYAYSYPLIPAYRF